MVYKYSVNISQTYFSAIFQTSQAMTISIDIPTAYGLINNTV